MTGRVRKSQVHKPDQINDQLTPEQVIELAKPGGSAKNAEEFDNAVFSQLKRIIFGNSDGNFYENFQTLNIMPLSKLTTTTSPLFTASCLASDLVGDLVYITGAGSVSKVNPAVRATMPAIGIITSKISPTECTIQTSGSIKNVYSGLIPNKTYYVGIDGRPIPNFIRPAVGSSLFSQSIGYALDEETLVLSCNESMIKLSG